VSPTCYKTRPPHYSALILSFCSRFGARELGHREHELHRLPSQAARLPRFVLGLDFALGKVALKLSTCRYLCFAISCTVERVRLLLPWRRHERSSSGLNPAGAPPAPSPIPSEPFTLDPTVVIRKYRFVRNFVKETLSF
jgi:hypothetical protein